MLQNECPAADQGSVSKGCIRGQLEMCAKAGEWRHLNGKEAFSQVGGAFSRAWHEHSAHVPGPAGC